MSDLLVDGFGDRTRIVLVRTLQPGNVGSAARAMKNMGLSELVLVKPESWDLAKAAIMAPGATDLLESATFAPSVRDAIADCQYVVGTTARGRKFRWPVLDPGELAGRVLENPQKTAILFGPENSGLSNEDLLLCHAVVTIQTDVHASLNLAQAVLVIAYEIFGAAVRAGHEPSSRKRKSRRGHREHPAAPKPWLSRVSTTPATADRMLEIADRGRALLEKTSYLTGRSPEQIHSTLYQWLQRVAPSDPESEVMLGMLAKLTYSVDHRDE